MAVSTNKQSGTRGTRTAAVKAPSVSAKRALKTRVKPSLKAPGKPASSKKVTPPSASSTKPLELEADEQLQMVKVTPAAAPKQKLVRDSFTMPQVDFDLVDILKARALVFRRPAKKSELLRAGLHALAALSDAQLRKSLEALTPLKAGRPKKPDAVMPAPKTRG